MILRELRDNEIELLRDFLYEENRNTSTHPLLILVGMVG
jgi:hypothetical protein